MVALFGRKEAPYLISTDRYELRLTRHRAARGDLPVALICRRPLACGVGQITGTFPPVLCPIERGASRSSRNVGCGMRWTLVVRLDERTDKRTAKPRGSDISTLISTRRQRLRVALGMVARKPDHQEERGAAVKTIRAGKAGSLRRTCGDYARVLHSFGREAAGVQKHPAFPAPSAFWRDTDFRQSSGETGREKAEVCLGGAVHPSRRPPAAGSSG